MDLLCPKCREPWDNDSLHDEAEERKELKLPRATYDEVFEDFKKEGCKALETSFGGEHGDGPPSLVLSEIYGAVGSDSDFAMTMIADAQVMGML